MASLSLRVLPDLLAVCRLEPAEPVPLWATGDFLSITRTTRELSIVCPEANCPGDISREGGWRALGVEGQLDFGLVGILAGLSGALAEEGISVFVISTYDTDHILVREAALGRAVETLRQRGYRVDESGSRSGPD